MVVSLMHAKVCVCVCVERQTENVCVGLPHLYLPFCSVSSIYGRRASTASLCPRQSGGHGEHMDEPLFQ